MVTEPRGVGSIQAQNLAKTFVTDDGQVDALENMNVEIYPGEYVSLIGPSGCGKSTFLRLVAGLETPTEGTVCLDGIAIQGPSHKQGLVFQSPKLFPWMNVYENIAYGLRARGVYKTQKQKIKYMIELIGLTGFEKSYPHHLSGGMAQRAALARALINNPEVLCLDEPLAALDEFLRVSMQDELLKIWKNQNLTMIMVTHNIDEAIYVSDRIFVMKPRPGRIHKMIKIDMPHPRNRMSAEFVAMREEALGVMGIYR